jgi:N6-adenosine-specific RNA methylase IME4
MYSQLDKVPEGKNITWNKLITKYLSVPKEVSAEIIPPEGLYNVIVIDPPWPIEKIQRDCRPNQIDMDYEVMNLDQIESMKIPAAEDCHVWLWTTHKYLPAAFALLNTWGLKY